MLYNYEIKNNGKEDILYLYLSMKYEFSTNVLFLFRFKFSFNILVLPLFIVPNVKVNFFILEFFLF